MPRAAAAAPPSTIVTARRAPERRPPWLICWRTTGSWSRANLTATDEQGYYSQRPWLAGAGGASYKEGEASKDTTPAAQLERAIRMSGRCIVKWAASSPWRTTVHFLLDEELIACNKKKRSKSRVPPTAYASTPTMAVCVGRIELTEDALQLLPCLPATGCRANELAVLLLSLCRTRPITVSGG